MSFLLYHLTCLKRSLDEAGALTRQLTYLLKCERSARRLEVRLDTAGVDCSLKFPVLAELFARAGLAVITRACFVQLGKTAVQGGMLRVSILQGA